MRQIESKNSDIDQRATQRSRVILLTIRSEHANRLYDGTKRAELRKSFPRAGAGLIFLYETNPVAAVTGVLIVQNATKLNTRDAIEVAVKNGVERERAAAYYGERKTGWVIEVAKACRLETPMPVAEARSLDHYFTVPQVFTYLQKTEALTQELISRYTSVVAEQISVQAASPDTCQWFQAEVQSEVEKNYEDIDSDFVSQITDSERGSTAAFSTSQKEIAEIELAGVVIGATVLTTKAFSAIKTGPTLLREEFRRVGLGSAARRALEEFCASKGARSIYCTCPANAPGIMQYLLASGMELRAILKNHLSSKRDEYVLSKQIPGRIDTKSSVVISRRPRSISSSVVGTSSPQFDDVVSCFLDNLPAWYFKPQDSMREAIREGIASKEKGSVAFSEKPKALVAAYGSDAKRPRAAVLATWKRSGMVKLNISAKVGESEAAIEAVNMALTQWKSVRRFYLTIPTTCIEVALGLGQLGFQFEGILKTPFRDGHDHICLGRQGLDHGMHEGEVHAPNGPFVPLQP